MGLLSWLNNRFESHEEYGTPSVTLTGQHVRSKAERVIADYFSRHGIAYYYEAVATTNGRFIATSTPGSRDSLFYEMCMDDDLYGDFSRHHVSFHDALEPGGPLKKGILEKLERQMREDPWRWQREMLAEFSEDEEAYFTYGLIDSAVDNNLEYVTDLNKPAAGGERKNEH
jgi:hypothetical protein